MADDSIFRKVESEICDKFSVSALTDFQKQVLKAHMDGKDVLVCSKTGSGKSLMYQGTSVARRILDAEQCECDDDDALRDVHDVHEVVAQNKIVIVIVPLLSIMIEHVEKLSSLGFAATFVGKDHTEDGDISAGKFDFIYGRPEDLVGDEKWRNVLQSNRKRVSCIVIDEVHTVVNWGESQGKEDAFRVWFSKIGELRSLCPGTPLIAGTATASPSKRKRIMTNLGMNVITTKVIVDSPDRENIKLSVKRVKATEDLSEVFKWILLNLTPELPPMTIFCKTIRECGCVFNVLSKDSRHKDLIQMYHSRTLKATQDMIRQDMSDPNGKIRVLVCSNSAGMGVNFASLNNVVNYGPPQDVDTFVQQLGRAGRDGSQAQNLLLYNARQLRNVDKDMLSYVRNKDCRRTNLLQSYGTTEGSSKPVGHLCCDVCSDTCECGLPECSELVVHDFLKLPEIEKEDDDDMPVRHSNQAQRTQLLAMLEAFRNTLSSSEYGSIVGDDAIHGFSSEIAQQLVDRCDLLDNANDIFLKTDIMSFKHAVDVADIFAAIFPGTFFTVDGLDSDIENDD